MSTSLPSGILVHPTVWPQKTWDENWEAVSLWEGAGSPYVVGAEAYLHAKFHFDPPAFDNNTPTLQTDEQDRQRSDSIGRTRLWATIRKTVRPMLAVRCLSVLSVCL